MSENKNYGERADDWTTSRFEEFGEDEFEASDRDSDFAAIYTDEDDLDLPGEDPESEQWDFLEEPESTEDGLGGELREDIDADADDIAASDLEEVLDGELDGELDKDSEAPYRGSFEDDDADLENADWELEEAVEDQDSDNWLDEPEGAGETRRELNISLGMIAVAATAVILLAIGGYGIIEQRAELREQVRDLRAQLATAAPPSDVSSSRAAAAQSERENRLLRDELEQLSQENRSLQAIVNGLESQLESQQKALQAGSVASRPAATPSATAKPASQASPATQAEGAGGWFVNFSSYTQRETAEKWIGKLQPASGRVVVTTGQSAGKTVYRVRVIDLADKNMANDVARALEQEYKLPRLWVGQD